MTRVVSITPVPVERDSRTFKHAASLARLGYESVVLEGAPSGLGGELPFELASVTRRPAAAPGPAGSPSAAADRPRRSAAMRAVRRALDLPITLGAQLRWNLRTHRALPPADLYYLHSYNQFLAVALKARRRGRALHIRRPRLLLEEDSSPEAAGIGRLSRATAGRRSSGPACGGPPG